MRLIAAAIALSLLLSNVAHSAEGLGGAHGLSGQTLPKGCAIGLVTDARGVVSCAVGSGFGFLNLTQNLSGDPPASNPGNPNFWPNYIDIISDVVNGGTGYVSGLTLSQTYGGTNETGGRIGFDVISSLATAPSTTNSNNTYIGTSTNITASVNVGGIYTESVGYVYGLMSRASLTDTATWYRELTAGEFNVIAATGTSVEYKNIISLVGCDLDAVNGSIYDTMLAFSNNITAVLWNYGILFGPMNGTFPIKSTGTIIGALFGEVAIGIDFSTTQINNFIIKGPNGVRLSRTGRLTGANFIAGGDEENGAMQIGTAGNTGTPHIDYIGAGATTFDVRLHNPSLNAFEIITGDGILAHMSTGGVNSSYLTVTGGAVGTNLVTLGATSNATGPTITLGGITGGSGYTNGVHTGIRLTGGSAIHALDTSTAAVGTVTVAGGAVTGVALTSGGVFYSVGNTLTAMVNGLLSVGTITPGIGYTFGTYTAVPLTGGTGTGALAIVIVSSGRVQAVAPYSGGSGSGYTVGDILSASNADLGGTGSGFSVPVTAVTSPIGAGSGFSVPIASISTDANVNLGITFKGTGTIISQLPTTAPLTSGAWWVDNAAGGVVKIVP